MTWRLKNRLTDKYERSNRGRARTSAEPRNRGAGRSMLWRMKSELRNRFERASKKAERRAWRAFVEDELFSILELESGDPEVWLYGFNLATWAEARAAARARVVIEDPYEYRPDRWDWHYHSDGYDDDWYEYMESMRDSGYDDDYDDWYDRRWDRYEPPRDSAAWRDEWVAGRVSDDDDDRRYDYWCEDEDYVWDRPEFDNLPEPVERVVVESETPAEARNLERRRAGERYFQTYHRARAA